MAPAARPPPTACRQIRVSVSPCSVSASTRRRVQARPSRSRRVTSSSASALAAKAATSTRSAGGSSSATIRRSGGGRRAARGHSSRPLASRWARLPSGPKRVARSTPGRAARSPRVRRPRRTSRSARSGRSRVATGKGARKPWLPPGGTMAWWRAASPAAKVPSAIPTRQLGGGPPSAACTAAVTAVARAGSPPWWRAAPRAGNAHSPGRSTSTQGVSASTATSTGSKARASLAGSWASSSRPGQRVCASRRRRPGRTPSSLAAGEQATTRLAWTTATWPAGGAPAATTGQSGHQTTSMRGIVVTYCPRERGRRCLSVNTCSTTLAVPARSWLGAVGAQVPFVGDHGGQARSLAPGVRGPVRPPGGGGGR